MELNAHVPVEQFLTRNESEMEWRNFRNLRKNERKLVESRRDAEQEAKEDEEARLRLDEETPKGTPTKFTITLDESKIEMPAWMDEMRDAA